VALNGLEAMSEGGRLRLRLVSAGDRVKVEISDTGPGVDEKLRDRLFDAYVTGKDGGMGAGLYIARSLLESQGGAIELTSTSAQGTTFTIELPSVRGRPPRSHRGALGRSPA
jgi:signal transduction histidine kinase